MTCPKCSGLVVQHQDTSYEPVYWKCLNCGWAGRCFERVPDHLCTYPGCHALLEAGWIVCQRHHYEAEMEADTVGKWSEQAKAALRAKRGKPPLPVKPVQVITNGTAWKAQALKDLENQKVAAQARVLQIQQAIASLEAL